jgi:hypothetical protein
MAISTSTITLTRAGSGAGHELNRQIFPGPATFAPPRAREMR